MSLKSIDAIVDAMVEIVDESLSAVEPPCVLPPVMRLTDEKVDEMVESGTFAELLMLATHFWELPQATRLMVLHKTTVDPFIFYNNFDRFFCAFGFHTYFAKYAVIRDDAVRNELCEKEFNSLIATMQSQLREVVLFQRPACPVSLKESFCENAENMRFLLPLRTGMDKDYEEVQRIVRLMAFELKYPEFAASITPEDRKVHYEAPRPLKKKRDSSSSSSSSSTSSSSSSSSDSDSEDEKKKCTKSSKDKKIECTNQ